MIILDSTILIDLIRSQNSTKYKKEVAFLEEIEENGNDKVFITFVSVLELKKGAYKSSNAAKAKESVDKVLKMLSVIEFEDAYYDAYGEISAELEKNGTPIGKFDELIAAIAIYNKSKLVTNNAKDFSRIPGLEIISH